jgi:hypothetical protein
MAKTLTVEGALTAVDARTSLTTQGSVTAPSLVVPSGMSKIDRIIMTAAADGLAVGSAVFFLRLGGNAVLRGEQSIMVSAAGTIAVQTGSDAAPQYCRAWVLENCDITVTPSDTLTVSAEMAGSDLGTGRIAVTLFFA